MAYFDRQKKRVELPSDPTMWVDVYADLTWREMKVLGSFDENGQAIIAADKGLSLLVADWNLEDENGKAPIDEEHLGALKIEDVTVIFNAINGQLVQEEAKKKVDPASNS